MIEIYTDGACCGNGKEENHGGFSTVIINTNDQGFRINKIISKQVKNTTNNRMELSALLLALELSQTEFKNNDVKIYSDSAYCVNIFNEWITNWCRRGWIKSNNKPIENIDLIQRIYEYKKIEFSNFEILKCKGHNNILGNELADAAASNNKAKLVKIFQENDLEYAYEVLFDF